MLLKGELPMPSLTEKIKDKAKEIGFDLVGITSAEPFRKALEILKKRELSEFTSKDLKMLTTPRLHLPGARTIISLAMSYASSERFTDEEAYIALYARGRDYHHVFREKMELLMDYIKELRIDARMKAYTDTGPILEREIARRAGLGWIGKNNNLINPRFGSYLFLGEILTNLDLELDQEIEPGCGHCERCIQSCPGNALIEPYYLDPEQCISYLTQKRGILPEQERKKIGRNLWGCDTCQRVCPYNRDIPVDLHLEFTPLLKGDFKKVLGFMKHKMELKWQESALSWRGLRILKRNTLINIANSGNNEYIPLLEKELNNPSPVLRVYAVWALGELGSENSRKILRELYRSEKDQRVRKEIKEALEKLA